MSKSWGGVAGGVLLSLGAASLVAFPLSLAASFAGLFAMVLGVLLVTGDQASCDEAKALLGPGLQTVAVKQGLGAQSARMIPPVRARELIEDGARRALSDLGAVAPYNPGSPCEIKVEFKRTPPVDRLICSRAPLRME